MSNHLTVYLVPIKIKSFKVIEVTSWFITSDMFCIISVMWNGEPNSAEEGRNNYVLFSWCHSVTCRLTQVLWFQVVCEACSSIEVRKWINIQTLVLMTSNTPVYNIQPNLESYLFFKLAPGISVLLPLQFSYWDCSRLLFTLKIF